MSLEHLIFSNLINSDEFARKTLPHLKPDYFHQIENKAIYRVIDQFVNKFNTIPSKEALKVELQSDTALGLSDDQYTTAIDIVDKLVHDQVHELTWLLEKTEKFCQDKAVYNAIMESIRIMDKEEGSIGKGAIPQLLTEALAISFDTSIGHDFFDDAESRYKAYHEKLNRIPFQLDCMNEITKGGFPRKTINILLGGTGVGKSLCMCALAADNLMMGYNVLYITLELDEKSVGRRIDANLLGVTMDDLETIPEATYMKMVDKVHGKTKGRLKVKEYPTSGAGAANFRHLLNELKLKSNFIPDIIYIDYLNICTSSRLKNIGSNINSYTYIKAIAEELRGLASEFDIALVTATQTTRGGFCLDPNSKVVSKNRGKISLGEVIVGDLLLSDNGWNEVKKVFPKTKKKMYKITTKSGKIIVASEDHKFPTSNGEKTIKTGLYLKDKLFINAWDLERPLKEVILHHDEIIEIECIGFQEAVDIEVSGNHLFFANDILTHNSDSDVGITDVSESFGVAHTADWMCAIVSSEELAKLGQYMFKQLNVIHIFSNFNFVS
jgi:archaellum biogenesis ATPase FlaH